jgi:hypothetical protein
VLDAELVEHGDDRLADVVLGPVGGGQRGDERVDRALELAGVQRGPGVVEPELGRAVGEPDARGDALRLEVARCALDDGQRLGTVAAPRRIRASATAAVAFAGSSSSARRSEASSPDAVSSSASDGTSPSKKRSTTGGPCAPVNSSTTLPSLNALTAGMPWMRKARAVCWLASGVELGEDDLALARGRRALDDRPEHPARPAPLGPEVHDDGELAGPVEDLGLEGGVGDVDDGHAVDGMTAPLGGDAHGRERQRLDAQHEPGTDDEAPARGGVGEAAAREDADAPAHGHDVAVGDDAVRVDLGAPHAVALAVEVRADVVHADHHGPVGERRRDDRGVHEREHALEVAALAGREHAADGLGGGDSGHPSTFQAASRASMQCPHVYACEVQRPRRR